MLQRYNVPDTLVGGAAIYQALNWEVKHNGLIHDWTCLDTLLGVFKPSWTCLNPVGRVETQLDVTFGHTSETCYVLFKKESVCS